MPLARTWTAGSTAGVRSSVGPDRVSGRWTTDSSPTSPARQRLAARFDMSLPDNQRKLEAVEQLAQVADEAGVSLIELAIVFVVNHPVVTAATIGAHDGEAAPKACKCRPFDGRYRTRTSAPCSTPTS
jgi:aryl-alcohol dehydrogenase-like predicted oxidoreductase